MGELVGKLHRPVEVVPHPEYTQRKRKKNVCTEASKKTNIVARVSPIETYAYTHIHKVLANRGDEYPHKEECQQRKKCR
jgi:hypothetical protein